MARRGKRNADPSDFEGRTGHLNAEIGDLRDRLAKERSDFESQQRHLLDAQRELLTSRERYAELYDFAPVGYIALDRNGIVKETNLTAIQMLGVDKEHLVGTPLRQFVLREGRREFIKYISLCRAGERHDQITTELPFVSPKGGKLWVRLLSRPGKGVFRIALVDITARREAEEALRRTEQRFRAAVDNFPGTFIIYDRDRRIQFINSSGLKYTERPASDFIGKRDEDVWPRKIVRHYLPHLKKVWKTRRMVSVEITISIPKRESYTQIVSYVPLLNEAREIQEVLGITFDITDRKRMEDALRESEARLRTLVDNLPFEFWALDSEGRYTVENALCMEAWGGRIGQKPEDVAPGRQVLEQWLDNNRRAMSGEIVQGDVRYQRGDEMRTFHNIVAPVRVGDEIRGILGVNLDITERIRAEEELERSRTKYKDLVQNANSAIIRWRADGAITFFNEYSERFFGYKSEEVIGKHVDILVPPRESTGRDLKGLIKGISEHPERYSNHVNENVTRDGRRVWMNWTNRPICDEQGNVTEILAVGTDITEQKHAEAALRDSEERYRLLFDRNPDGVFSVDANGRFLMVNPACAMLTGYSAEELKHKVFLDLCAPEHVPQTQAHFRRKTQEKKYSQVETTLIRKDGQRVDVWLAGGPLISGDEVRAIHCTMKDITERRETERALRDQEERLRLATRIGQIGTWYLDFSTDRFSLSERAREIFGLPQDGEVTLDHVLAAVHSEDRPEVARSLSESVERTSEHENEFRVIHPDGTEHWVTARCRTISDASGNASLYVGVVIDSTEQKAHEQQLAALNESLEQRVAERTAKIQRQADQLRAMANELTMMEQHERRRLARILHDHVQQLLVAARMQLGAIKKNHDHERQRVAGDTLDGLLVEALDATRTLSVELSPPILNEAGLIGGLNWLASRLLSANQFKVHLDLDEKAEPSSEETRFLLFECARELLLNSVKHSGVSEAKVSLNLSQGDVLELSVSDLGAGFDAGQIDKKGSDKLTMGLFGIRQRLAHIGGEMEIDSAPGAGSRFKLRVPAVPTAAPEVYIKPTAPKERQKKAAKPSSVTERCRVLIVDDHEILREGLAELLQLEPEIQVVGEAADGPQSILLARNLVPDVIVMDVNLGEMSGIDATRRILNDNPGIKIIGLSMHLDDEIINAMKDAGAVAYLPKGGPAEDLITAILACAPMPPKLEKQTDDGRSPATGAPPNMQLEKKIHVLVADDHETFRHMLSVMLAHEKDIEIVGEAKDGEEAIQLAHSVKPDVVVMDVRMPRMSGVEATRKLLEEMPGVKVVGLSAYGEEDDQPAAMRAQGAVACVKKESTCKDLLEAIRRSMQG